MTRACFRWAIPLVLCATAFGQTPEQVAAANKSLDDYRNSKAPILRDDFGEMGRYRAANAALAAPAAGEKRVVFFGDSITDIWPLAKSFPGKPYVGRGIGGQTTRQMLVRFRADVINLKPAAVVILAGTNDIAGNTGPMALEEIEGHYTSLEELARANHIRVVMSSVLPVHNYTPKSLNFYAQRSPEKILALNKWMKDYCALKGCVYLDYFTPMVDSSGMLKKELADDGLHPNPDGYAVMAPLAEAAIQMALAAK
jgi:lysophospholipase L1-like esterase